MTIQDMNEILYQIDRNPVKTFIDLSRELETYANKHSRCYKCGKELVQKIHNEKHEAYGSECNEQMVTLVCEEHGEV